MGYEYKKERGNLFTESGTEILLKVRDEAKRLIAISGACTAEKAMANVTGSSWTMLAALDYLIERGELKQITRPGATAAQDAVYVSTKA